MKDGDNVNQLRRDAPVEFQNKDGVPWRWTRVPSNVTASEKDPRTFKNATANQEDASASFWRKKVLGELSWDDERRMARHTSHERAVAKKVNKEETAVAGDGGMKTRRKQGDVEKEAAKKKRLRRRSQEKREKEEGAARIGVGGGGARKEPSSTRAKGKQ